MLGQNGVRERGGWQMTSERSQDRTTGDLVGHSGDLPSAPVKLEDHWRLLCRQLTDAYMHLNMFETPIACKCTFSTFNFMKSKYRSNTFNENVVPAWKWALSVKCTLDFKDLTREKLCKISPKQFVCLFAC